MVLQVKSFRRSYRVYRPRQLPKYETILIRERFFACGNIVKKMSATSLIIAIAASVAALCFTTIIIIKIYQCYRKRRKTAPGIRHYPRTCHPELYPHQLQLHHSQVGDHDRYDHKSHICPCHQTKLSVKLPEYPSPGTRQVN